MVRLPDSWRFSLSASSLPENPLPTPSAGVRITPLRSKPMDGVDEPCSPTPPTGHQHQSGHVMCYEGRTSSRAIDTVPFVRTSEGAAAKCVSNDPDETRKQGFQLVTIHLEWYAFLVIDLPP